MTKNRPGHPYYPVSSPLAPPNADQVPSSSSSTSMTPDPTARAEEQHQQQPAESANGEDAVDLLILGAGWTAGFLIPMIEKEKKEWKVMATTRDGRNGTIPFIFDPESNDTSQFVRLPYANTVLITFPLKGPGPSKQLTHLYDITHPQASAPSKTQKTSWIQLGSTGIYPSPPATATKSSWIDYTTPHDSTNLRAIAEDELLSLKGESATVLNLSGLCGHQRQLRHWLPRVAKQKSDVARKGAVHMIHGNDVSRAIIGAVVSLGGANSESNKGASVIDHPDSTGLHPRKRSSSSSSFPSTVGGRRWPITDLHIYDWWDLFLQFGAYARAHMPVPPPPPPSSESPSGLLPSNSPLLEYEHWVLDLMTEHGVRALPRTFQEGKVGSGESATRLIDGRAFWEVVGQWPREGRADRREPGREE